MALYSSFPGGFGDYSLSNEVLKMVISIHSIHVYPSHFSDIRDHALVFSARSLWLYILKNYIAPGIIENHFFVGEIQSVKIYRNQIRMIDSGRNGRANNYFISLIKEAKNV